MATGPEQTGSDPDLILADPDPVSLEDADPDLNLALLPQIIWGQNQHYIPQRPFFLLVST